ncbi:hypothetical protein [Bacillus cereus]|uniref:hypothetical protein n=1 Tax=Bacillus cereus TaxID=1396 RepID=UPI001F239CB1|nr:hypothetical protein [Bacillus cereus]BCC56678.1 hypothetical protein BCJMU07_p79 [Bacillus cereus]
MNLQEFREKELYPLLEIKRVPVTNTVFLRKIRFPKDVLAPLGTFNTNYYEELKQREEDKNINAYIIDGNILHEQLKTNSLSFYVFHPKKRDVVEGYGGKYIDVHVDFKGFGLYHIVAETGLKVRKKRGDRRFLEVDKDAGIEKEEIYLYYDEEEKQYKRTNKKTFENMLRDINEFKFSDEIAKMIYDYKTFFSELFLNYTAFQSQAPLDSTTTPNQYIQYTATLQNQISSMEEYYDYYLQIGGISKESHERISQQISDINAHSKALQNYVYMTFTNLDEKIGEPLDEGLRTHYMKLKRTLDEVTSDKYWINTFTGEFTHNMKTFHLSQVPTEFFEDEDLEQKRKLSTLLDIIFHHYINVRKINIENGTHNESGIFYDALTKETNSDNLDKNIEERLEKIRSIYDTQSFTSFPEIENLGYLFESNE